MKRQTEMLACILVMSLQQWRTHKQMFSSQCIAQFSMTESDSTYFAVCYHILLLITHNPCILHWLCDELKWLHLGKQYWCIVPLNVGTALSKYHSTPCILLFHNNDVWQLYHHIPNGYNTFCHTITIPTNGKLLMLHRWLAYSYMCKVSVKN